MCHLNTFKMHLNPNDRIQKRILIKKHHEEDTEKALEPYFKKAKCFFDIGGNIGFFSLQAASLNPELKVIAFEPLPANISQFTRNIQANPDFERRITIKELCLGDSKGKVTFLVPPKGECGWGTVFNQETNKGNHDNWQEIERQASTLDLFLEEHPKLKPDIIKIDVEGSEYRVLKGAFNYLENNPVKMLCIELNEPTLKSFNTSSQEVIEKMSDLGYQAMIYSHYQLIPFENASLQANDFNCFFIPKGPPV